MAASIFAAVTTLINLIFFAKLTTTKCGKECVNLCVKVCTLQPVSPFPFSLTFSSNFSIFTIFNGFALRSADACVSWLGKQFRIKLRIKLRIKPLKFIELILNDLYSLYCLCNQHYEPKASSLDCAYRRRNLDTTRKLKHFVHLELYPLVSKSNKFQILLKLQKINISLSKTGPSKLSYQPKNKPFSESVALLGSFNPPVHFCFPSLLGVDLGNLHYQPKTELYTKPRSLSGSAKYLLTYLSIDQNTLDLNNPIDTTCYHHNQWYPNLNNHFYNLLTSANMLPPNVSQINQIKQSSISLGDFLNFRHRSRLLSMLLALGGNVESNPGPNEHDEGRLHVITHNVRGLGDEKKLRHLLNKMHQRMGGKNRDFIASFQESYLEKAGKIPYIWRGNFFLTPGNGHSCGCLTLLSPHLNIIDSKHVAQRGHILACQRAGEDGVRYIIVNIYAPNPNNQNKIEFFEELFDKAHELQEKYSCENILIMGDFNLVFKESEVKNRLFSAQERRVAATVKNLISTSNLTDSWDTYSGFTWRRPGTDIFSTIDRVVFCKSSIELLSIKEDWSISFSDHAAVVASFKEPETKSTRRSRITRLDPHLAKVEWSRQRIVEGFEEMFSTTPSNWDPHKKLEFAKMCIRTVVEKVQAERKIKERSEEESLDEELEAVINRISKGTGPTDRTGDLIDYAETLRAKKALLINEKGARLAEKLGTKWYNEGEKSTRYFLRLLNRSLPDDFKTIIGSNGELVEPDEIEKEIVSFYKNLYETYDRTEIEIIRDDDDFFQELQPMSYEEERHVTKEIELSDLTKTLQTCKDSAPGPDGIPYSILRIVWSTFGPLLCDAWNHSLVIGKLPESHKLSYLKLIPKVGKDQRHLNNWRPITLSNCDHKLITKTYATRMCESVVTSIKGRQTAYLKGRLINDNIRAMLASVNCSNLEEQAKGLLISLDAKKAFDSVEHGYIERCLKEFGCARFIPIFRILYSELKTNINVNGKIVDGFRILRGVKQGDALSCVIFIMCMEPLLRNLESNPDVQPVITNALGSLPKVYAYADDVNGIIKNCAASVQAVFNEYQKLSTRSGLVLNADKTEIMLLGSNIESSYDVTYLNKPYTITTKANIKVNGIVFQRNYDSMVTVNVKAAMDRMDKFFKSWSRRSLSTLGKVLIVKTFGISQLVYLMQTIELKTIHYKMINNLIYKFIWNRHYLAAKAPERIKREIMCKPVKLGGFGMLDIMALDESLKIKSLARTHESNHPFICLLAERSSLKSYFYPHCEVTVDPFLIKSLETLKKVRDQTWDDPTVERNRFLLEEVREIPLRKLVNREGQLSLFFFSIRLRGKTKVGELTPIELGQLNRFIDRKKTKLISNALLTRQLPTNPSQPNIGVCIKTKQGVFKEIARSTSKEIRDSITDRTPICSYKIGETLSIAEALTWGNKLSRLTSTKHKNTLLRFVHGEFYTRLKLCRFNLSDTDECPRCGLVETLNHKFLECDYVKRIWSFTNHLRTSITTTDYSLLNPSTAAMGSNYESNLTVLTLNAEVLLRISYLKADQNFLLHPKTFVKNCLRTLARNEKNVEVKETLENLLTLVEP